MTTPSLTRPNNHNNKKLRAMKTAIACGVLLCVLRNYLHASLTSITIQQHQRADTTLSLLLQPDNNEKNYRRSRLSSNDNGAAAQSHVALCIRGVDRHVPNAENIYKHFVQPLAADVFAVIQTATGQAPRSLLATTGTSHNTTLQPVASDYTNYNFAMILSQLKSQGLNETFWGQFHTQNSLTPLDQGVGSAFFQYKSMCQCRDLIQKHEQEHRGGVQYKRVVVIRTEHWCLENDHSSFGKDRQNNNEGAFSLSNLMDHEAIVIPQGQDWGGLNDRMVAMPRQAVDDILTGAWNDLISNSNAHHFTGGLGNGEYVNWSQIAKTGLAVERPRLTCFLSCIPGRGESWWSDCTPIPGVVVAAVDDNTTTSMPLGAKYKEEYCLALEQSGQGQCVVKSDLMIHIEMFSNDTTGTHTTSTSSR
jgi:hypothetical protein